MAGTIHGIHHAVATDKRDYHAQHTHSVKPSYDRYVRYPSRTTVEPTLRRKLAEESSWSDPPWVTPDLIASECSEKNDASAPLRASHGTSRASHGTSPPVPDEGSDFVSSLRTCAKTKDLCRGTLLHDDILKRGLLETCKDSLITMYAKCGALEKAKELLDMHKSRNVITWTALISGYAHAGQSQNALDCFDCMQRHGIPPNAVTYACVLKACASLGATQKGKQIHDEIAKQGLLQDNLVLGTALVDMYAKCGVPATAQRVHEELPFRDSVSWNALITGYAHKGQGAHALSCFDRMQQEGVPPNAVTYICILKACSALGNFHRGKQIHDEIASQGLLKNNVVLGTALVDMYAKCGALSKAQCVLEELPSRNVVSWSALITGYAQEGKTEQALSCFKRMRHKGIPPNAVTYASILKVCGIKGADYKYKGKQIHDEIVSQGLVEDNIVLGTALVDMYAKCGALSEAQHVLDRLCSRDVISWSALIGGYADEGEGQKALSCFESMLCEGISPNAVTYASMLKACGSIGASDRGEQFHDDIVRQGLLQNNVVLGTALVDMYSKCGALSKAQSVHEGLSTQNVVSWNALIAGFAEDGQGEQVLSCFKQMQSEGIPPNAVTFICVLNVCSHLGLVELGHELFISMRSKHGVEANLECYTCMVDLFGRAGHLERAVRLIQEMPSSNYPPVWLALLAACQKWGDVSVGKWAFDHCIQVDRSDASPYVLMANIYATAGMKERVKDIKAMRIRNQTCRKPGPSRSSNSTEVLCLF